MAKIAKQLTELIGHTPLLELTNYEKALGLEAKIIAKLEYFNPLGSVKDRVAAAMIEQGIKDGKINQDRKSTRLNSSHRCTSRMPSSA